MAKEIETKFKIKSPKRIKNTLKEIGARLVSSGLEKDIYYKNPLTSQRLTVFRLRAKGNIAVFTIKIKSDITKDLVYKVRDEFEINIEDIKTFKSILYSLGFKKLFLKEKMRHIYKWKDAAICVDELPFIGFYVEIEARKQMIKKVASLLGFDMNKAIPKTYTNIFDEYKILNKKPKLELVFGKK